MTPEQIFYTALDGVLAQGGPSRKANSGCRYRGPGGRKCPVGHLIDDATASIWDGYVLSKIGDILESSAASARFRVQPWMLANKDLLVVIQKHHDWWFISDAAHYRRDFEARMAETAIKFNIGPRPVSA